MTGTCHLAPRHKPGSFMLGPALTVRVREGDNLMIHKALHMGRPGDILVVDGAGSLERALFGEIMKNVAMARGFAGVVFDGAIRDVASYRKAARGHRRGRVRYQVDRRDPEGQGREDLTGET